MLGPDLNTQHVQLRSLDAAESLLPRRLQSLPATHRLQVLRILVAVFHDGAELVEGGQVEAPKHMGSKRIRSQG